jgi:hypothetical protein
VPSFSQRHAPPPQPLGPEIPEGVRRAIASWFHERGVEQADVRRRFFQGFGYGSVDDIGGDIRDRWGEDAYNGFYRDLQNDPEVSRWHHAKRQRQAAAAVAYRHVPEPLYLDYVEIAVEKYTDDRAIIDPGYVEYVENPLIAPVTYLNELFAARGIDYRFSEDGKAEWHGDEGGYHEVIRPALDALADERLAACRQEFDAALDHLRRGTAKDREDAIEEAGKAVESAMKVLLAAHGIQRDGNETAEPLWNLLRENEIVPPKTKDAILSASRLRNEYGGHGAGEEIRNIPNGIPELAVRDAAVAIAYLAGLLP